jgi:hypothetical protein
VPFEQAVQAAAADAERSGGTGLIPFLRLEYMLNVLSFQHFQVRTVGARCGLHLGNR